MDNLQYWTFFRRPGESRMEMYTTLVRSHTDRESAKQFLAETIGCAADDIEVYGGAECLREDGSAE